MVSLLKSVHPIHPAVTGLMCQSGIVSFPPGVCGCEVSVIPQDPSPELQIHTSRVLTGDQAYGKWSHQGESLIFIHPPMHAHTHKHDWLTKLDWYLPNGPGSIVADWYEFWVEVLAKYRHKLSCMKEIKNKLRWGAKKMGKNEWQEKK